MPCQKTGLGAQCAHPEPRLRAHCACSAQVVRTAALTVDWSRACWARAGRDMPRQLAPGRDLKAPGRDTKLTQPLPRPGRDAKSRSRSSCRLPYVATSFSCRDIVSTHSGISRSRRQKSRSRPPFCPAKIAQVATPKMGSQHQFP